MLQIKEDDKFFTRLLTKERSKYNNNKPSSTCDSFRVYYGDVPLGVPFLWEAKPGTPKHPSHPISSSYDHDHHDLSIPPLTPPPSYALRACDPRAQKVMRSSSSFCCKKSKLFNGFGLFPRMIMHRPQISSLSMSSSSSGIDSVSDQTQNQNQTQVEKCLLDDQEEEYVKDGEEKEEEEMMGRGTNTMLCFGLAGCTKMG